MAPEVVEPSRPLWRPRFTLPPADGYVTNGKIRARNVKGLTSIVNSALFLLAQVCRSILSSIPPTQARQDQEPPAQKQAQACRLGDAIVGDLEDRNTPRRNRKFRRANR